MGQDSQSYLAKKAFFEKVLTVYGRHTVMEALENEHLKLYKLHLSNSNKPNKELEKMIQTAKERGVEIVYHDKKSLSRISKNSRQDQGVALDVEMANFISVDEFIASSDRYRIVALDGVTNPQNLGMIIRSCAAGKIDALLLSTKGNAQITPLVIQSSVGTVFKLPIIKVPKLSSALEKLKEDGATLLSLRADAKTDYRQSAGIAKAVYVLGNESEGVSPQIDAMCDSAISIEMNRGVESLNVAVTAVLISFL